MKAEEKEYSTVEFSFFPCHAREGKGTQRKKTVGLHSIGARCALGPCKTGLLSPTSNELLFDIDHLC